MRIISNTHFALGPSYRFEYYVLYFTNRFVFHNRSMSNDGVIYDRVRLNRDTGGMFYKEGRNRN